MPGTFDPRRGRAGEAGAPELPAVAGDVSILLPHKAMEASFEALRAGDLDVIEQDLTVAGARVIPYRGNNLAVLYLAGVTPLVYLRFDDQKEIPVRAEMSYPRPFKRIRLRWGVIANGWLTLVLDNLPW